jgi:hypothetical protein
MVLACLVGGEVSAQTAASYKLTRDDTDTGVGFDLYAGATSAARAASETAGERSTGALGAYASSEFWAWADTASIEFEEASDWKVSVWPIYGTRWGVRGGAHASAHLVSCFSCTPAERAASRPGAWQASETLELHSGIINLLHAAGYQRSVQFADNYWRSRRNLATVGFGIEIPFVVRFDFPNGAQVNVQAFEVFGREVIDTTLETEYRNLEVEFSAYFVDILIPHEYSSFHGRLMGADVETFARPRGVADRDDISSPTDARIFVADLRGITFDQGRNTFGLYAGFRQTYPAHVQNPNLPVGESDRPGPVLPDLALHFASHQAREGAQAHLGRGRLARDLKYHASVGTFARVGPSGFGVDRGWKLELDGAVPLDRGWVLRAQAVGVTAWRAYSGRLPEALEGVPRPGTRFLLGRAEVGAAHRFTDHLVLDMTLWVERSDRFRPDTLAGTTSEQTEITSQIGVSAALTTKIF